MKFFLVVVFVLILEQTTVSLNIDLFLQSKDDVEMNPRIIGGNEAELHQFPYQAAIVIKTDKDREFCGGSIISDEYILTAGHCLESALVVHVILGAHDIHKYEISKRYYVAEDYWVHENWDTVSVIADIALVKLPEKIEFNHEIKPIRLPGYSDIHRSLYGTEVLVSGWGKTSDTSKELSPVLRFIKTHIISQIWCKLAFLGMPSERHICISGIEQTSICGGDSGGPLVTIERSGRPTLQGIASFGFGLGCQFIWPAVFTRVSSYLDWIHNKTEIYIPDSDNYLII